MTSTLKNMQRSWFAPAVRGVGLRLGCSLVALSALGACDALLGKKADPAGAASDIAGTWRLVLDSPGGDLPVTLEIRDPEALEPGAPPAVVHNGEGSDPFTHVDVAGRRVTLRASHYDSALTGELDAAGTTLVGTWQKTAAHGRSSLPFRAYKGQSHRFAPEPSHKPGAAGAVASVAGSWAAKFRGDHDFPALGELAQDGDTVTGTFLTNEGDTRYLAGRYTQGVLELSSFNGAFASLFRARARDDGTLSGQFWSNDDDFYTFTARRVSAGEAERVLAGGGEVEVTSADKRLRFEFPDTGGELVSLQDERFQDRVVLVVLMGSWCQNCNDEAPLLAEWYERYRERGLEIIGLSYEFTGDADRDRRQVAIYKERHGLDFPVLLAGTVGEGKPLPELSTSPPFPTTIFIGRDGTVRKIHSGFSGPSTGEHYERLVAEFEAEIEALLDE